MDSRLRRLALFCVLDILHIRVCVYIYMYTCMHIKCMQVSVCVETCASLIKKDGDVDSCIGQSMRRRSTWRVCEECTGIALLKLSFRARQQDLNSNWSNMGNGNFQRLLSNRALSPRELLSTVHVQVAESLTQLRIADASSRCRAVGFTGTTLQV